MKRACVLLVFIAISVASFCQIEYSTYQHFNWIAVSPNYYADYEKVLAQNKVKSITEIITPYEGTDPTDSFYVYEIDKKGRQVKFSSKLFNYNDVSVYNDAGLLSAEIRFGKPANDTLTKTFYKYDTCGNVTNITFWAQKNGLLMWQYINHYDSACVLLVQDINHNNKLYFSTVYEYDSAGNIAAIKKRDSDGKVYKAWEYKYDSLRRIIAENVNGLEKRITYNAARGVEKINYTYASPDENCTYFPNGLKKEAIREGQAHIVYSCTFYK